MVDFLQHAHDRLRRGRCGRAASHSSRLCNAAGGLRRSRCGRTACHPRRLRYPAGGLRHGRRRASLLEGERALRRAVASGRPQAVAVRGSIASQPLELSLQLLRYWLWRASDGAAAAPLPATTAVSAQPGDAGAGEATRLLRHGEVLL